MSAQSVNSAHPIYLFNFKSTPKAHVYEIEHSREGQKHINMMTIKWTSVMLLGCIMLPALCYGKTVYEDLEGGDAGNCCPFCVHLIIRVFRAECICRMTYDLQCNAQQQITK